MKLKHGTKQKIAVTLGLSHSAVSQWFSGSTQPNATQVAIMERDFNIDSQLWLDISHPQDNDTKTPTNISITKPKEKVTV